MTHSSPTGNGDGPDGATAELLRHVLPPLIGDPHLFHEDRVWLAARHAVLVEMATTASTDMPLQLADVNNAFLRVLARIEQLAPGLTGAAGLAFEVRVPLRALPAALLDRARDNLEHWRRTRLKPALAHDAPPDASLSALRMWEARLGDGAAEGSAGFGLKAVRRRAEAKRAKGWKSADLPADREELLDLVFDTLEQDPVVTRSDRADQPKNLRWRVGRDGRFHLNENLLIDRLAALLRKRNLVRPPSGDEAIAPETIADPDAQDALQALQAAEALEAIRALQEACIQEGPAAHAAFVRVCESLAGESAPSRRAMAEESSPPTTAAAIRHAEQSVRLRVEALLRRFG